MPIWGPAKFVVLERSSAGQTAQVLGEGDTVLATCDDAGNVTAADGAPLLSAPFVGPRGLLRSNDWEGRVDVSGPDGSPVGRIDMTRFAVGPFRKKLTLALRAAGGGEVGRLMIADKKGRELSVTAGETEVARIVQVARDRGLARTVERWSVQAGSSPPPPVDVLGAAAVLRYNKIFAELNRPDS